MIKSGMGLAQKTLKRKKKEERLYHPLKERLEQRGYKVYPNINLGSYKYKEYWTEWFGKDIPPLQPQIDLLLVKQEDFSIRAIEVKYFEMKGKRIDKSYYEGIDAVLALMNFGFESVALWQCFDKSIPLNLVNNYRIHVLNLRETMSLRFDYSCFQVTEENGNFVFRTPLVYEREVFIDDIPSNIEWRHTNPLKYQTESQKILDFIRHVLRIPTK